MLKISNLILFKSSVEMLYTCTCIYYVIVHSFSAMSCTCIYYVIVHSFSANKENNYSETCLNKTLHKTKFCIDQTMNKVPI